MNVAPAMILFVALLPQAAPNEEVRSILARSEKVYRELKSFRADLLVTTTLADTEIVQEGTIRLKNPGRAIVHLRQKESKKWAALYHADGERQYRLDLEKNRILRRKADPKTASQMPFFFPSFGRYDVSTARLEETVQGDDGKDLYRISVDLKEAGEKSVFRSVRLLVQQETWVIREMEFLSAKRRRLMSLSFQGLALDPEMKDDEFRWEKPADLADVPVVEE